MTQKYKYWHKILDASPDKKEELEKDGSNIKDLFLSHYPPKKPNGRLVFLNMLTKKESWIDLEYVGRLGKNESFDKLKELVEEGKK